MRALTVSHLSNDALLAGGDAVAAQEHSTTAEFVAHIAEIDSRRLFAAAGYPSLVAFCVERWHLSEDAALKRIRAARAARDFPVLLAALHDGRLHLTAVCRLAGHLTTENVAALVAAATHKSTEEVARMLAQRFPRSECLPMIVAVPDPTRQDSVANDATDTKPVNTSSRELVSKPVGARSKVTPHAPQRYLLELTMDQRTRDDLQYATELLSHAIPTGDPAEVIGRALRVLIERLEKQKFAATTGPRTPKRSSADPRYISAHVQRVVWERDGGQCTFVGDDGHRCGSRERVEFDHIVAVARGGLSTVENVRLRCRAHNQLEADRVFGAGFMLEKRDRARGASRAEPASGPAFGIPDALDPDAQRRQVEAEQQSRDLLSSLRGLGFKADDARRATEFTSSTESVTLEERFRAALQFLRPRARVERPARDGLAASSLTSRAFSRHRGT